MSMKSDDILPFVRKTITLRSDLDEILAHVQGKPGYEQISPALEEKLKRMQICRDWLAKYGGRQDVIPRIRTEFGLSRAAAYALLEDTMEYYNTTGESKGRNVWVDIILSKIFETWRKAHAKNDFKTAAICEGRMIEVVDKFFGGFEAKMYERIQPPAILFGFFPELTNVEIPDDLETQVKKLIAEKKKKAMQIEDIEFEDITGGEHEPE